MKEEVVKLSNIEVDKLISDIKQHFVELGLQIIHEDNHDGYWSIKAHKGGKLSAVTGSIRDVEILMTGSNNNYDLTLRTGAWGRDIAIPALLASAVSFGAGAAVAGAEAYRAYKFEKNFWVWLNQKISSLNATISTPSPVSAENKSCNKCHLPLQAEAKFCMHCGSPQ
ncbi:MAG TPA: zinc ribbon domain-containing protein [Candidatus Nitrosotalea sp.]|nr:zinc ribbon domain-containing protein [Candidatus Nitrosotalea sp.]